ncbi:MAG: c-type cytochrome biogenesis protein CcsB [Bacteroidales bacterium]|nr:c-type cytochrome biogenesis protein CcsB [Bacteroidales bacterium]MDT8374511.1 c-type cytochrome biogenesis protein CcsB [Bacteroidales bacterium]
MKTIRFLFTPLLMGILFIVLAIAMAVATFIENDFGPDSVRALIYNTRWFELLFLLLVVNLAGQIVIFRLYRKEKLTVMLFHAAFIVMVIGAAITRFTGYDGMMHIREGETTALTWSSGDEVRFEVSDPDGRMLSSHSAPVDLTGGRTGRFKKMLRVGDEEITLKMERFIPGAVRHVEETPDGVPVAAFLATPDMVSSQIIVLQQGETWMIGEMSIGLDTDADISVISDNSAFFIRSIMEIRSTSMQDMQTMIFAPDTLIALVKGTVYTVGGYRIMPQQLTMSGTVVPAPDRVSENPEGALECTLTGTGYERKVYLWTDEVQESSVWQGETGNLKLRVSYGSSMKQLPFSLTLDDFIIERYPGSNSPSGFKSRVTLADADNETGFQYDIYMNHILKYREFRFYQSSYDPDEKGTVLSVNHDPAGMMTTYTGYGLLFLFIILTLLNRRSFFRTVRPGYWSSRYRKPAAVIVLALAASLMPVSAQKLVLDKDAADSFGGVLVQDQKGRTKPLYTVSSDIMRKVARENTLDGLSPMQVFLGCSLDFYHWQQVPMIKVSNEELRQMLGLTGERAAFSDIVTFGEGGGYRLSAYVEKAYAKAESERSRFDKEVIKVDERVNICYMMSKGEFMRIFPLRDGTDHWGMAQDAVRHEISRDDSLFVLSVVPMWVQSVTTVGKGTADPDDFLSALKEYQRVHTGYELPSAGKVKAELFYYRAKIFEKLFPWYATVGLIMITVIITFIIRGREQSGVLLKILFALIAGGFIFHTLGLGIRWYISGHSPMSNGYESMLFISWVTLLAGLIFSRKSLLTLAATSVLGGLTLMVAHLSFMDPEITNLVPVLKSYWLTLHVSVITGSYGFLGLGAILGLIVLIMMLFVNGSNRDRISSVIDELTVINYRSLTLGLYFLTVGTFLGAVWANESWGRYWGWDPKETWSLITIIVYTLVTHSRMIPGMKETYTFNLLSLFALSSVLMTYFGVNYYLSGLHSYAGGDPVPVPVFVYIAVGVLVAVAVAARYKYRQMSAGRK